MTSEDPWSKKRPHLHHFKMNRVLTSVGRSGNRCQSMSNFDIEKRCFKDPTKSLRTHLEYLEEHEIARNWLFNEKWLLVISKSIDKCNMSLLAVVVLGIESTHHYVHWQADSPPLLQFPACSIAWKCAFWSKNDYRDHDFFESLPKGESDLAVSGWDGMGVGI